MRSLVRKGSRFTRVLSTASPIALPAAPLTAEALERRFLLGCYSADGARLREGLVIERGQGSTLYDSAGGAYLDFFGGIAVNALGHSDARVAAVMAQQAQKVQHVSNLLHTWEPLRLARRLVESTRHFAKAFFANSGTEANEAALKFARKAALVAASQRAAGMAAGAQLPRPPAFTAFGCKATPPSACFTRGGVCGCWPQAADNDVALGLKPEVIAFKGSFHGRTQGALAVTHKPSIRMPFAPLPADVRFARFNNLDDVHLHWNPRVGAVIVEPVQGEGGVFAADLGFMRGIKQLCVEHGALMIVDEVQCGLGRSGRLWAHEAYEGVAPDMMTLAKPLAGGLPIGAVLMSDAVAAVISPGDHGTTFGGNPFVTRVAEHVLERIAEPAFLAHTRARGRQLFEGCEALQRKYPGAIREVRTTADRGLFVGVELLRPFRAVQEAAAARGLLVISCGENTIRLCPPLIITEDEVAFALRVLDECFAATEPQ